MFKVLIVEDDTDIQELLENHLCGSGYEVTLASDSVEAISLFEQRKNENLLAWFYGGFERGMRVCGACLCKRPL